MIPPYFIYIAFFINLFGTGGYILDTLKGKVKPNRVTFFLWPLAPLLAFAAQIVQGAYQAAIFSIMVAILPLLVLIASFVNKKAEWKLTKFDIFCGVLSLCGLFLWLITKVGNIAIFFSILTDGLASLPTIVKAYKYPETEVAWPWLTTVIYAVLGLLTLTNWNFASVGFPVYYFFDMFVIYLFAQTKIGKKKIFLHAFKYK